MYNVVDPSCPRGLRRSSAAARLLKLRVRILQGAWMSVVSVTCCQVEVCATSWSLVQRSPTECGASLCVWPRNLINEEALVHWGLPRPKKFKKIKTLILKFPL